MKNKKMSAKGGSAFGGKNKKTFLPVLGLTIFLSGIIFLIPHNADAVYGEYPATANYSCPDGGELQGEGDNSRCYIYEYFAPTSSMPMLNGGGIRYWCSGGITSSFNDEVPLMTPSELSKACSRVSSQYMAAVSYSCQANDTRSGTTCYISTVGVCGDISGKSFTIAPVRECSDNQDGDEVCTEFCVSGAFSGLSGSGPWTWTCAGANNGSAASCSAEIVANDCASRTCTTTTCNNGINVVPGTVSCPPNSVSGSCGNIHGKTYDSAPYEYGGEWDENAETYTYSEYFCASGIASGLSGSGPWSWSCFGIRGGPTASCSAAKTTPVNGICGPPSGQTLESLLAGSCTAGTYINFTVIGPWSWTCQGSGGGENATCNVFKTVAVINGTCGSSDGQTMASAPTVNFCSLGTPAPTPPRATFPFDTGAGWLWSCNGSSTGSDSNCSASKPVVVDGACNNTYNGQTLEAIPSTGLCSTGVQNPASVSGAGPWSWTCNGINGGDPDDCSAQLSNNIEVGNWREIAP